MLILNEKTKVKDFDRKLIEVKQKELDDYLIVNAINLTLYVPEYGINIGNRYLTKDEINSDETYIKKVSNYIYATNQGYFYNSIRDKKNYGKANAWDYMTITLKGRTTTVNNALYDNLVEPIKEGYVIHHLDHDKTNNKLSNLEMITRADNLRERFKYDKDLGKKMAKQKTNFYILNETNQTLYKNKSSMASDLDMLISAINKVIDGTWTQYKGYKFRYLEPEEQIEAENYISFSNKHKKVKLSQLTF